MNKNKMLLDRLLEIKNLFIEKIRTLERFDIVTSLENTLNNLEILVSEYSWVFDDVFSDDFRYVAYYDKNYTAEESLKYFNDNYNKEDKHFRCFEFSLYCLITNLMELIDYVLNDKSFDLKEILDLYNIGNFYGDLEFFSDYLCKNVVDLLSVKDKDVRLDFLNPHNQFQIYFTGRSLEDISGLEKKVVLQLIRKLNDPLATKLVIPMQTSVEHLKTIFNYNVFRIQFSDDYRIIYIRYKNVTAILGVCLKTGKYSDYSKYDSVARRGKALFDEIDNFIKGDIVADVEHYKVINILCDVERKNRDRY